MIFAGFWIRFSALIIDAFVLLPLTSLYFIFPEHDYGLVYLFILATGWLYEALFESGRWQATPGMFFLGLKVTNVYGEPISFARASARHFAKYITGITLGLGYLMNIWTERRQTLHDKIAGTVVLNIKTENSFDKKFPNDDGFASHSFDDSLTRSRVNNRWIFAGFDSNGHVVRIGFNLDDPSMDGIGLIIGRDAKHSDIYISDASISRRHARLFKYDDKIFIEDLGSTNGVAINGRPLSKGGSSILNLGGSVTLGGIVFSIGRE